MEKLFGIPTHDLMIHSVESGLILALAIALILTMNRGLLALSRGANLPNLALRPVRVVLRYGILVLAVCLILTRFGVNVNGILTVLATGAAMIAIGFVAVWSVLSNFLCTFVLIIFKPFSIGDDIEFPIDQIAGRVVDLTLIYTTLRGKEGELYQIPNNMFFQKMFKCRPADKAATSLDEQLRQNKPIDLGGRSEAIRN